MKVSLSWLQEYVDIKLPPKEVADRLAMAGIEAKSIQIIGEGWENIVVGRIMAVNPHPDADRLRLTTVNLGIEEQTVVCGAPNLYAGDNIAFASVGTKFTDPDTGEVFTLKRAKIRDVESAGMVCSERELGISDDHTGIMVLPPDAPLGVPLADYLGDTIYDFEVTPNRPDCLSVIGIAREIAVLTGQILKLPEIEYKETNDSIEPQISVEISAPDLCPRYCVSLIHNVNIRPSPMWMQKRLLACGMRPISNVVDITNYVMLEYGQPLHSFDYTMIKGKIIKARRAGDGEMLDTLDGTERALSSDMLVIADEGRAVAVAGVMGGANSEVTEQTTSILLEAASFNAASIHRTGATLGLPSEARYRFERGIRPEIAIVALKRATQLLCELADGQAARGVIDIFPGEIEPEPIALSIERMNRLLGLEIKLDKAKSILTSLGFECNTSGSPSELLVTTPYWRSDIKDNVDLMEEVARINGYDEIPVTLLSEQLPAHDPDPFVNLKREASRYLVGCGFHETVTFTLTGLEILRKLFPGQSSDESRWLRVANPMTLEQEYLRPNLRANLMSALASNRRHEDSGIRLFELGKVYLSRDDDLPEEPEVVCGVLSGPREDESWHCEKDGIDFYDAKGIIERLFNSMGVDVVFKAGNDESFHPNKQVDIVIADTKVGVLGELHPRVTQSFDLSDSVYMFEVYLRAVLPFAVEHKMYFPVPRFPAVVRDIALIIDNDINHGRILEIIESIPLVARVTLFDVYSGKQVQQGKKSLAYRVAFQSPDHTLTDEEVDKVQQQLLNRLLKELGASLRS